MNYTGFGTDPNLIYSFRRSNSNASPYEGSGLFTEDAFQPLRESLAYKQAGMEGKQRMERAVSMGLPANTDIDRVQRVGYNVAGRRPIYVAPRPQPWGTYGSVGMNEEERPVAPRRPAGGAQPAKKPSLAKVTEIKKTELGESGEPIAFTPFGERVRQESQPQPKAGSPFPAGTFGNVGRWFDQGAPRFPYAGY
jgi:hypothetical protein